MLLRRQHGHNRNSALHSSTRHRGGRRVSGNRQSLDERLASFETAASQLPQDEEFSNAMKDFLVLRSAQGARLDARTAAMQPIF
jgi:hypothetical protein